MRLNRFLAQAGLGSRRGVEELIVQGRVRVNGRVVEDLATQVLPEDVVKVGNRVVRPQQIIHAILNKPPGYVVSADDEQGRRTIYDLLPDTWPRVFHVGRLDKESEGLLIVTNDGDLSLTLTHPRYQVEKEYEVKIDQPLAPEHRAKLLRGFMIPGGRAKMEEVHHLSPTHLRVVLRQGLKREIRLMLYELGYEVEQLRRTRIGALWLGGLRPGEWRMLTRMEVTALRSSDREWARSGGDATPAARPRRSAASRPSKASSAED